MPLALAPVIALRLPVPAQVVDCHVSATVEDGLAGRAVAVAAVWQSTLLPFDILTC